MATKNKTNTIDATFIVITIMISMVAFLWSIKNDWSFLKERESICLNNKIYDKSVSGEYWIQSSKATCIIDGELK
jgi:hypothetical protein